MASRLALKDTSANMVDQPSRIAPRRMVADTMLQAGRYPQNIGANPADTARWGGIPAPRGISRPAMTGAVPPSTQPAGGYHAGPNGGLGYGYVPPEAQQSIEPMGGTPIWPRQPERPVVLPQQPFEPFAMMDKVLQQGQQIQPMPNPSPIGNPFNPRPAPTLQQVVQALTARGMSLFEAIDYGQKLLAGQRPAPNPNQLQAFGSGGQLVVDPKAGGSAGLTVAGPATVIDAAGQPVAMMGEAGGAESISNVTPLRPPPFRRDEQFRYDALPALNTAPMMGESDRIDRAINPGRWETDAPPQTIAARLLGHSVAPDMRYTDPFVKALALGQRPTPGSATLRDVMTLPQDDQQVLASIIGSDLYPRWMYELGLLSPNGMAGVHTGAIGGVRA